MRYTNEQKKIIKQKEYELQGELQKAVWSVIRNNGKMRLSVLSRMIGRRNDSVYTTCQKLIEYNMIEKVDGERGVYRVSDYILNGE